MPGFNGRRVLSFESRRGQEIAQLIRNHGGAPLVAPSTREVESPNHQELDAIQKILNQEFDAVIFMTGVGARALVNAAGAICPRQQWLDALGRTRIVVRGPKPAAVMRELGVPITLTVPEPNTWRELVRALDENPGKCPLAGRRIAVQEHGEPSSELSAALRERGAEVTAIRVYRWALPEDLAPLQAAIEEVVGKRMEVVLFTSSVQLVHALQVANEMGVGDEFLSGLEHAMVGSIGPISSEALRKNGVRVDLEPSHPKMGFLVKEAAERSSEVAPSETELT
jgi:uroporphyrinogen-III synthase